VKGSAVKRSIRTLLLNGKVAPVRHGHAPRHAKTTGKPTASPTQPAPGAGAAHH
jgi:hypothetical protein